MRKSMTVNEMAVQMLDYVNAGGGVSFVELQRLIGEEADGLIDLTVLPHVYIWRKVSNTFADAITELKKHTQLTPATLLVYLLDGKSINLPVKRSVPGVDPRRNCWLPVVFNPKTPKVPSSRIIGV